MDDDKTDEYFCTVLKPFASRPRGGKGPNGRFARPNR